MLNVDSNRRILCSDLKVRRVKLIQVRVSASREEWCIPPLCHRRSLALQYDDEKDVNRESFNRRTLIFFSSVSNSLSNPAFLALSAMRCFKASNCASCRTWLAIDTYFPLGLNFKDRPTRSRGVPSNPVSADALAAAAAYGFSLATVGGGGAAGGGVGTLRALARIDANLGCIGL